MRGTGSADTAARVWYGLTVAVIAVGLIVQLVLVFTGGADANSGQAGTTAPLATRLVRLFSFFTIDSNVIVLVVSILALIRLDRAGRAWRVALLDALLSIVITGLVFAVVLAPQVHLTGWALVATICFHYVSPWLFLAGWLLLGPRRRFAWWVLPAAFVWPVVWLLYTFVHGAITHWYPYPFLDVTAIGLVPSLLNSLLVLLVAAVLAVIARLIDQWVPSFRHPAVPARHGARRRGPGPLLRRPASACGVGVGGGVGGDAYAGPMTIAQGTFDVRIDPADHDQPGIGRMMLTKTWHGDLSGEGVGTMLSAGDPTTGEAGYVALETVEGTLAGRTGAFAFQQSATVHAGAQELRYEIVPGSGTGELAGIVGTLALEIVSGEHRYRLDYALA